MTSPRDALPIASNKPDGGRAPFILASASPRRKTLLEQIGAAPDQILPADIDETPKPGETPRDYALRVATEKCDVVAARNPDAIVLAADTVVGVGRRILPKTEDEAEARFCLQLMSGRSHRVLTGVSVASPAGSRSSRVVETRVKIRRLDDDAIAEYIESGEWRGKAGGYAIQGLFSKHVISIIGSHPNVVGLPTYDAYNMLVGAGWRRK